MKKPTVSSLKKKADTLHSRYIRLRDSDANGYGECITCGAKKHWKEAQCGHFVTRANNKLRFDEMNTNLQCLTAESNVDMYGNYQRSIADLIVGDVVQAFDEKTFKKTVATVISKHSFIPDELYEVEMEDGSRFWATGDHRVVANGKWMYIKDMLHSVSTYNILEL